MSGSEVNSLSLSLSNYNGISIKALGTQSCSQISSHTKPNSSNWCGFNWCSWRLPWKDSFSRSLEFLNMSICWNSQYAHLRCLDDNPAFENPICKFHFSVLLLSSSILSLCSIASSASSDRHRFIVQARPDLMGHVMRARLAGEFTIGFEGNHFAQWLCNLQMGD